MCPIARPRNGKLGPKHRVALELEHASTRQLKMCGAGADSQRAPVIPIPFDPAIMVMGANRMLFSGLEWQGDQAVMPTCRNGPSRYWRPRRPSLLGNQ